MLDNKCKHTAESRVLIRRALVNVFFLFSLLALYRYGKKKYFQLNPVALLGDVCSEIAYCLQTHK